MARLAKRIATLIGLTALAGVLIAAVLASVNIAAYQIERTGFRPFLIGGSD